MPLVRDRRQGGVSWQIDPVRQIDVAELERAAAGG
jgi:hypothetical protein